MHYGMFYIRLILFLVPFVGGILWLGKDNGSMYYEKSPTQIKSALNQAVLPIHILGDQVKGTKISQADDSTIITTLVDKDGNELMRFVTEVIAEGEGSLVNTEVKSPEGVHADRADRVMKEQAFTMSLMEKLADEHVAAAIEERPFDLLAFNPAAKGLIGPTGSTASFDQANRMSAEIARSEKERRFREQYGNGWGESGVSHADGWGRQ